MGSEYVPTAACRHRSSAFGGRGFHFRHEVRWFLRVVAADWVAAMLPGA